MDRGGPYERYYAEREASGERTVLWPWLFLALVVPLLLARSFTVSDDSAQATATHEATSPAPSGEVAEGVYRSGFDVVPGTWTTVGPLAGTGCGYVRSAPDGVEIARAVLHGPGTARIADGESVVFTGSCVWTAG